MFVGTLAPAWAQTSTPSNGGGIKTICPNPGVCFANKAAKDKWAADNNCQFLEDVCEKTPANADDKGAKPEDAGFWSGLWNDVAGAVQYGYEFSKGLFAGLKGQITDIIDLISDPVEVAKGLVALGKAFYDDPKGTMAALAELLGQEAVDTIAKATQCGAYDLGKVIGSYVSPAVALKLAAKLGKFTGKVADAVKGLKVDLGCASFAAGTVVQTRTGLAAIETLSTNDWVASRNELRWSDAEQRVTSTFGRIAPSYRKLQTELELFDITDEHPLWVQGKGWTPAKDVVPGDSLASLRGDVLVASNTPIEKSLRVYNFSVANTPNYFVGESGLWAHNASTVCDLSKPKSFTESKYGVLKSDQKGFKGELEVRKALENKNYEMVKGVDNKPDSDSALKEWKGKNGIDGIYKNKTTGEYVIVESKATGGVNPSDPSGCVAGLCNTQTGRQMSKDWITERINKDASLSDPEKAEILAGLNKNPPTTKRVYAQSDDTSGTKFFEIVDNGKNNEAYVGTPWNP